MKKTPFTQLTDLACERLGGKAIEASDEFFAPKENLLKPGRGIFIADKYTEHGKWMDGWETRRKRSEGHDWCLIRLGLRGIIRGVNIDTNHFLGNHPPFASVEGLDESENESGNWSTLVERVPLERGSENLFSVDCPQTISLVRLNIFPDGGVARFRVFGEACPQPGSTPEKTLDLACVQNGGLAISCSNMFFSHMQNLLLPDISRNMGDGWETERRRGPGHDWVIVRLGSKGVISGVEVDTRHFKGNYPDRCRLEGCVASDEAVLSQRAAWTEIQAETKLSANHQHYFEQLKSQGPFTHVRLSIFPDGGVARLRVFGRRVDNE